MQKNRDIPSQLPAKQPLDTSWIQTNEIPAIRPGVSTWNQVQQQHRAPVTPIPQSWHDELPKPVYRQWSMPKEKKSFDFDKFSARAMQVTVIIFAFLFLLICLLRQLIEFALMK